MERPIFYEQVEELKKKFNIPDEYTGYHDWNSESVEEALLKAGFKKKVLLDHINWGNEKYTVARDEYIIEGDGFIYINLMDNDRDMFSFLFAKDIDKFFKDYIYEKEVLRETPLFDAGVYKPKETMFGFTLSPVPIGEYTKPILNENLFESLHAEIDAFTKKKQVYEKMNLTYKRGILLHGAQGNGKTSYIRHLLHERKEAISIIADLNDYNGMDFIWKILSSNRYKDVLKIIVMEDIDGMPNTMRSVLLNFLDGVTPVHKTIFIATTNFPDRLDIAIKNRPSRFDTIHEIKIPNKASRMVLIKHFFPNIKNGELVEASIQSKGFSGAYFKELYVLSNLNDWDILTSITEMKKRFKLFS